MINEQKLYSLKDICVIPSPLTTIKSRSECICRGNDIEGRNNEFLPIIAAPMSCVLYGTNYKHFRDNKINVVIPRTVPFETRLNLFREMFCAFSMEEGHELLKRYTYLDNAFICLDMANGHMLSQLELGNKLKTIIHGGVKIMGGNIANPETYRYYCESGFDYVRVSVGSGSGCLSSVQTSIHYPMASLLDNINELRTKIGGKCKIIADGGMTGYSDIIKSLVLGADFVMAGLIFSKAATGEERIGDELDYYGMSTKRAQQEMGKTVLKTSEGKFLKIKKEYTLSGWVENMDSYLRSAMSYCDARTISEFRQNAKIQIISNETIKNLNTK
jgi:IMP dehydrogenase/GMP reductase